LGNGDGTFQTQRTFPVGSFPYSVAVGDFNGDGHQDLAVANVDDNTVSVLLGNGDGGFGPPTSLPVGSAPFSVAVGDFNGDGRLDLVVADSNPNGGGLASVLLGNGDGTFQTQRTFPAGGGPTSVVVGDFNGDGHQDLAVANAVDNTVSVLLGNGDGNFGPTTTVFLTYPRPFSVAAGDFSGDGKPDLAVASTQSDAPSLIDVFLNQPGAAGVSALGGEPLTVPEGHNPVVATFTDPTGAGFLGNYTATVATSNGLTLPGLITFDPLSNFFSVAMPYLDPGEYALTITIDKTGSLSPPVTVFRSLTVVDPPVQLTVFSPIVTEAAPFTGGVASFIDPGNGFASDFTATIDWGDGSISAGTVTPSGHAFFVNGNHTFVRGGGDNTLVVTVLDADGSVQIASNSISVFDAALTPVARLVSYVAGQTLSRVVGSFSDADPGGFAGLYSATINWGDNTPATPGTVAADGSGFDVSASHTYPKAGTYTITTTVQDTEATTTIVSTATVVDPLLAAQGRVFAVSGNQRLTNVTVATFSDPDPRKDPTLYTATIDWGDGTPTTTGTVTGGNPFTVTGSHTYATFSDAKIITVTISGPLNRTVTVTSRVVDPPPDPPSNAGFVQQLYQDLLGRPAEDAGLTFWSGLLDQGFPRAQVVAGVLSSLEYRIRVVQGLYQQLLHRAADANGLQTFTTLLGQNGSVEQVEALIVGSDEYFQTRAGATTAGFLAALYQDGLGRAPDATGAAAFTPALAGGAGRVQVAAAVFASTEYRQDLVSASYRDFLQRPADESGLAGFVAALGQGAEDADILTAILSSPEYFNRS
jgi:hypothetical protein